MYIGVVGEDSRLEDGCLMRTAQEIDLTTKDVAIPLEYRHVSVKVLE